MSEQTAQEPTMEEILASIRRIISEDDAPAPAAEPEPQPEPEAVAAPAPAPAMPDEDEDDVLELTETVGAAPAADVQTVGDLDVYTPPKAEPEAAWAADPEPEPEPAFAAEPEPAPTYVSSSNIAVHGEMTVVELVRAILEPKLNEWADENLQGIVESAVKQIMAEKLGRVFR